MPLSTMALIMLSIAALTDLMPKTLNELKLGRPNALVVLLALIALRQFDIRVSPEFTLNAAAALFALFCALIGVRSRTSISGGVAFIVMIAPIQFAALMLLTGDAAPMLAGLFAALPVVFNKSARASLLTAAFAPIAAALAAFLLDSAMRGYGVLEISKRVFDVQTLGALFAVFAVELKFFNKREQAAE